MMAPPGRFDLGIIGGGTAVAMAAPALEAFGSVAFSSEDGHNSHAFPRFTYVRDVDELFDPQRVRALYIATPVHLHRRFLLSAIGSSLPVLVEKPMCLDIAECTELAAYDTSLVRVAFRKRFSRACRTIRDLAQSQSGQPSRIEYRWMAPHPGSDHWKVKRHLAGGGVLMDVGSHVLDLFEHCLGRLASVEIQHAEFDRNHGTDVFLDFTCQFEGDRTGRVVLGWAEADSIQKLDFSQGQAHVSWTKRGTLATSSLLVVRGRTAEHVLCDRADEYPPMFDAFRTGRNGALPLFADGARNMHVINRLYELIGLDSHKPILRTRANV